MELLLIRHGLTRGNKYHLLYGTTDYPLLPEGIIQAKKLHDHLVELDQSGTLMVDAVYSSTLLRARQTAEIATKDWYHDEINYDERLIERYYGNCEGGFHPIKMYNLWRYSFSLASHWEEETITQLELRAKDFLQHLYHTYPSDAHIMIFSHAGFMTTLRLITRNVKFDNNLAKIPGIAPCGIMKITV